MFHLRREAALHQHRGVEALGHVEQEQVLPLGHLPLAADQAIAVSGVDHPADFPVLEG